MVIFLSFWLIIGFTPTYTFAGGATIVGDGGFVVTCKNSSELLDIYEARSNGFSGKINFGKSNLSISEKVDVGLNRMRAHFLLNDVEFAKVRKAARHAFTNKFDPLSHGYGYMYLYLLNQISPGLPQDTINELQEKECYLDVAIFRPKEIDSNRQIFSTICGDSHSRDFEFCFLNNNQIIQNLSSDQRACLALHEAFRYLPKRIRFSDQIDLRQSVAKICMNEST